MEINKDIIHEQVKDFEVSLFKLGLVSQDGYIEGDGEVIYQIADTYDFYRSLTQYWENWIGECTRDKLRDMLWKLEGSIHTLNIIDDSHYYSDYLIDGFMEYYKLRY